MMRWLALALAVAGPLPASAGGAWSIDRQLISSGGGLELQGGPNWSLSGSIGQPLASGAEGLTGAQWSLQAGFWSPDPGAARLDSIFGDRFQAGGGQFLGTGIHSPDAIPPVTDNGD